MDLISAGGGMLGVIVGYLAAIYLGEALGYQDVMILYDCACGVLIWAALMGSLVGFFGRRLAVALGRADTMIGTLVWIVGGAFLGGFVAGFLPTFLIVLLGRRV